jgi:succinate-semialdehyde dehydrogenase/glutarate-semialdehyde dehydrogenase
MTEQAELTRPATRRTIQTVNPATGEPGKTYDENTVDEARTAAAAAREAF